MPPTIILPPETPYSDVEKSYISEQPGNLFPTNQDSIFGTHRKVFCDEMEKIVDQIQLLYNERFPDTALQYLSVWEEQLGLPVNLPTKSIQQRQQAVRARISRGRFTRTLRRETVEGYILATFGAAAALTTAGIPITVPGIPLHSGIEGIDATPYYTITETITNFFYQVLIDSIIDVDLPALNRELTRLTPAGIQWLLGKTYKRTGGGKTAGTATGPVVGIKLKFGGGFLPFKGGGTGGVVQSRTGGASINSTNVANDAFGRTASSGWGHLDSGQNWTRSFGTASDFSVNGSEAVITPSAAGLYEMKIASLSIRNVEAAVKVKFNQAPIGTFQTASGGIVLRGQAQFGSWYSGFIQYDNFANGYSLKLNTPMQTFSVNLSVPHIVFNEYWWVKIRIENNILKLKGWKDGTAEPSTWQLTTIFTGPSLSSGYISLQSTMTGATPIPTATYDGFNVTSIGNSGGVNSAVNRNAGAISVGVIGGTIVRKVVRTGGSVSQLIPGASRIAKYSPSGGGIVNSIGGGTHS